MFESLDLDQFPPRLQDNPGHVPTIRLEMPAFKAAAKKLIQSKVLEASQAQAEELVFQGEFARLLVEEESCIDWQGLIHSLPRGLLSFAARLTSNTLASPDNLARWRKIVDPRCQLCDHSPCTLFHLLSNCPKALEQGRYDYRHDSVLSFLYSVVRRMKGDKVEVYCDLDGGRVNGTTIPPDIVLTTSKPDLVIVDRSATPPRLDLIELTIPWDSGTEDARIRKQARYARLVDDCNEAGYNCINTPLEIGARGLITQRNRSTLTWLCSRAKERKVKRFISTCSKLALLGSYSVWVARRSKDWTAGRLLQP